MFSNVLIKTVGVTEYLKHDLDMTDFISSATSYYHLRLGQGGDGGSSKSYIITQPLEPHIITWIEAT